MVSKTYNLHEKFVKKALSKNSVKKAYDELHDEFTLLTKIISLREKLGMTQEQVAEAMGTSTSVVGRLETGGGKNNYHSPTLATLRRYAHALNYDLQLHFVPRP